MKKTILIDGFLNTSAIKYLRKDYKVLSIKEYDKADLLKKIHYADGVVLKTTVLSSNELDIAKKLKVISRFGVGYDNLDLKYLKKRNIGLRITANSNKVTVAEHVLSKIFLFYKKDYQNDKLARKRIFKENKIFFGKDLFNSKILIFGYGRIAKELSKRCYALGMKVYIYDPYVKVKSSKYKFIKSYKGLLCKIDIISVHIPHTKKTNKFFDLKFFKQMKKESIFINTSRGSVVNEQDLIKFLKNNKNNIKFGLDVFEIEPPKKNNFILKSKKTFLTPHSATKTIECFENMSFEAVENIKNFFNKNDITENIVKV